MQYNCFRLLYTDKMYPLNENYILLLLVHASNQV